MQETGVHDIGYTVRNEAQDTKVRDDYDADQESEEGEGEIDEENIYTSGNKVGVQERREATSNH